MSKTENNTLQDTTRYLDIYEYGNITHRPHMLQYIAMDLPLLAICIAGWCAVIAFSYLINPWTVVFMSVFTLGLVLHCQYVTSMKYHIGTEQLMFQRGLFTLQRDYIEMYRIVDYEESRSFIQILFGLKSVTVHACDRTTPNLKIIGVPVELDLIPAIRERVEHSKRAHGVYEIANR